MNIRMYLRCSTTEQDPERARPALDKFAADRGHDVVATYIDRESGATADRRELMRLLSDSLPNDVILIESIDRLSRMNEAGWRELMRQVQDKGLNIVALDLPSTHAVLDQSDVTQDDLTRRIWGAMNQMIIEVSAAQAAADYTRRRERQAQGIAKAKAKGTYKGRQKDYALREKIYKLLDSGFSKRGTARMLGCSHLTVYAAIRERDEQQKIA